MAEAKQFQDETQLIWADKNEYLLKIAFVPEESLICVFVREGTYSTFTQWVMR